MSDEMTMLRELGRELEQDPPATLRSQRARLLERAARRRQRMYGWPLLAIVATGTAALITVPTVLLNSGPATPSTRGTASKRPVSDVPPPDPSLAFPPKVSGSVVKLLSTAPSCQRRIQVSGFVYAPERVLTVARGVAGTQGQIEVTAPGGRAYPGRVVLFDPRRDIAVIGVPGLQAPALPLAKALARRGDQAVVLGYPKDQDLRSEPARIRSRQIADGPDIYRDPQNVRREIYSLRGLVEPGSSGGPLTGPQGQVYGMVFAAALDDSKTGFALTGAEVTPDAIAGIRATSPVSTGRCAD